MDIAIRALKCEVVQISAIFKQWEAVHLAVSSRSGAWWSLKAEVRSGSATSMLCILVVLISLAELPFHYL